MNSLAITIALIVGAVLVYSAIKGEDPRDLVKRALSKGGTAAATAAGRAGSAVRK